MPIASSNRPSAAHRLMRNPAHGEDNAERFVAEFPIEIDRVGLGAQERHGVFGLVSGSDQLLDNGRSDPALAVVPVGRDPGEISQPLAARRGQTTGADQLRRPARPAGSDCAARRDRSWADRPAAVLPKDPRAQIVDRAEIELRWLPVESRMSAATLAEGEKIVIRASTPPPVDRATRRPFHVAGIGDLTRSREGLAT